VGREGEGGLPGVDGLSVGLAFSCLGLVPKIMHVVLWNL